MSRPEGGLRLILGLARALLRLYPRRFRAEYGERYLEAAEHRWRSERRATGGDARATLRSILLLVADAFRAVPRLRRGGEEGAADRRPAGAGPPGGAGGRGWLTGIPGDLRLALRGVARRPGFAALVILTLGLGIGASAAVFGALDRVVLRPLPYADGDRMAYLALRIPELGWQLSPPPEVIARWRQGARTVERIEVYRPLSAVLTGHGPAESISVGGMSAGMPEMLGIVPLLGRRLGEGDARSGADPVVMLSERYWRSEFGGDPATVGRGLRLNDTIFTVVGVWPEAARLDFERPPEVFRVLPPAQEAHRGGFAHVIGLLRRGVTVGEVEAELATFTENMEDVPGRPAVNPPYGFLGEKYVRGLWLVFAGGLVLMGVAVVNAANLMLGRVSARTAELGVRLALGGSGLRLARLLLVETSLLAGAGAAVGMGVAVLTGRLLEALQPGRLVPPGAAGLQGRATAFALGLAVAAAVVSGLVPLFQARRAAIRRLVAGSGQGRGAPRRSRLRSVLVAVQAGLAVLLVAGASLLARSFGNLVRVDTGVDIDRLATLSIRAPEGRYPTEEAQRDFIARVMESLRALPGVTGVVGSPSGGPLRFSLAAGVPYLEGEAPPEEDSGTFVQTAGAPPGYFDVLGIRLTAGRVFEPEEEDVVIVNEAFARSRGGDVLGRTLRLGDSEEGTIVGVANDVFTYDEEDRVQLYGPLDYPTGGYANLVLRTDGSPEALLGAVRRRVASIDPDVPILEARTGEEIVRERTSRTRFLAALLAGFAGLGLLFAVSGVYGVVSLDVGRRRREMGVRVALGASARRVGRQVLSVGVRPVAVGALLGVAASVWTAPHLETLLFHVPSRDPWSAVAAVVIVGLAAAAACLVPARRAARVDPASVLRAE